MSAMASQQGSAGADMEKTREKGRAIMESESEATKSVSHVPVNSSGELKPEFNVLNSMDGASSSKEGNGGKEPEKKKAHICKTCKKEFSSGPALGGHQRAHKEELQKSKYYRGRDQEKDEGIARFRFHPYLNPSYDGSLLRVQMQPQLKKSPSNHSTSPEPQGLGSGCGWPTAYLLRETQAPLALVRAPVHGGLSALVPYPIVGGYGSNGSYRSAFGVHLESIVNNPYRHYTSLLRSTPPPQPFTGYLPARGLGSSICYTGRNSEFINGDSSASTSNIEPRNPTKDDGEDTSGLDLCLKL